MRLLSIDPGKHTGWAVWNYGSGPPQLSVMGVTQETEEFYDVLIDIDDVDYETIVYENYHIRPAVNNRGWGHEWNRPPALLIIGALELFARQTGTKLVSQPASVLPVGCGYIGYNYRKGIHVPNNVSAIAHGAYWLVKNKHATPKEFKTVTS
jgi:hypothetical protein